MDKVRIIRGIAAPLERENIDTDLIYPKQFLRTITRTGLGKHAFHDLRYLPDGSDNPDFVLNRPEYKGASVLIAGKNFGAGSSREHAVWSLLDSGIRAVIAESFADIFYNNSCKNGLLPVTLLADQVAALLEDAEKNPGLLTEIDLERQTVTRGNRFRFTFEIDPFRKECLLNGVDDIGLSLQKEAFIGKYERENAARKPWLTGSKT